jgi:ribosome-binding protein aMBF1 (putative translation factor)
VIDPYCLAHGRRKSEHMCLICCLCYKDLTPETCHVTADGSKEDVCTECAEAEERIMAERAD